MKIAPSREIGAKLCQILGLDPTNIIRIDFVCDVELAAFKVTTTQIVKADDALKIAEAFQEYSLIRKEQNAEVQSA